MKVKILIDSVIGATISKSYYYGISSVVTNENMTHEEKIAKLTQILCKAMEKNYYHLTPMDLYKVTKPEWFEVDYSATTESIMVTISLDENITNLLHMLRSDYNPMFSERPNWYIYKEILEEYGTIGLLQTMGSVDPKELMMEMYNALKNPEDGIIEYLNRLPKGVRVPIDYTFFMMLQEGDKHPFCTAVERYLEENK